MKNLNQRLNLIEAQLEIIETQIDVSDPDDLPRFFVKLDELRVELEVLILSATPKESNEIQK